MNDFGLWPPFHVFIFIHDPHGSFYVLSSHEAFVKGQVMTDCVLLMYHVSVLVRKHAYLHNF